MKLTEQQRALLKEIGMVVLMSVFVGLVYNFFAPKGLSLIRTEPKKEAVSDSALFSAPPPKSNKPDSAAIAAALNDTARPPDSVKVIAPLHQKALANYDSTVKVNKQLRPKEPFRIITLKQFARLLNEHRGVLLDAREPDAYEKGHIKGAKNVPATATDKYFAQLVQIPRDTLVIIYCSNPECDLGRELAEFMRVLEFKNLVLYDDGWDGWVKAKMPIDSSEVD